MREYLNNIYLESIDEYLDKYKPQMTSDLQFHFDRKRIIQIFKENLKNKSDFRLAVLEDSLEIRDSKNKYILYFYDDAVLGDCFRKTTYTKLLKLLRNHRSESFIYFALNISDKFSDGFKPEKWEKFNSPLDITFKSPHSKGLAIIRFWENEKKNFSQNDITFFVKYYEHYENDGNEMNVFILTYHNRISE